MLNFEKNMLKSRFTVLVVVALVFGQLLTGCRERSQVQGNDTSAKTGKPRIGYSPNPLLGPLYAAQAKANALLTRFGSGSASFNGSWNSGKSGWSAQVW